MENETKHLDDGKLGLQWILRMQGLDDVARVGDYGAKKYDRENWAKGTSWMRFFGSMTRHLAQPLRGEWNDPESGLPHLAHLIYNALILLEWHKTGAGLDDRPLK